MSVGSGYGLVTGGTRHVSLTCGARDGPSADGAMDGLPTYGAIEASGWTDGAGGGGPPTDGESDAIRPHMDLEWQGLYRHCPVLPQQHAVWRTNQRCAQSKRGDPRVQPSVKHPGSGQASSHTDSSRAFTHTLGALRSTLGALPWGGDMLRLWTSRCKQPRRNPLDPSFRFLSPRQLICTTLITAWPGCHTSSDRGGWQHVRQALPG
jgi:hypothetical protein